MDRRATAALTTACVGMAVGTAAYMMAGNSRKARKRQKQLKRSTGKALRQVGSFIDNMSDMMR